MSDDVASGISSGGNKIFRISVAQAEVLEIEDEILKPVLIGREIHEYYVPQNTGSLIIYSTKRTKEAKFPKTLEYLVQFKDKLSKKRETVKGLIPWWSLHWPRNPDLFDHQKSL